MRPRSIQSVRGLDPNGTPFERFRRFAEMIIAVPKTESENEIEKSGSAKNGAGLTKRKVHNAGKTQSKATDEGKKREG
jgi:hypothetical protein